MSPIKDGAYYNMVFFLVVTRLPPSRLSPSCSGNFQVDHQPFLSNYQT